MKISQILREPCYKNDSVETPLKLCRNSTRNFLILKLGKFHFLQNN